MIGRVYGSGVDKCFYFSAAWCVFGHHFRVVLGESLSTVVWFQYITPLPGWAYEAELTCMCKIESAGLVAFMLQESVAFIVMEAVRWQLWRSFLRVVLEVSCGQRFLRVQNNSEVLRSAPGCIGGCLGLFLCPERFILFTHVPYPKRGNMWVYLDKKRESCGWTLRMNG